MHSAEPRPPSSPEVPSGDFIYYKSIKAALNWPTDQSIDQGLSQIINIVLNHRPFYAIMAHVRNELTGGFIENKGGIMKIKRSVCIS